MEIFIMNITDEENSKFLELKEADGMLNTFVAGTTDDEYANMMLSWALEKKAAE